MELKSEIEDAPLTSDGMSIDLSMHGGSATTKSEVAPIANFLEKSSGNVV